MITPDAATLAFDQDKPGALPAGWRAGVTGRGSPKWLVETDPTAPSRPNVLKQSGSGTFPWCVRPDASLADGYVEVTPDRKGALEPGFRVLIGVTAESQASVSTE